MKNKLLLLIASVLFSINVIAVSIRYSDIPSFQNRREHQEDRSIHGAFRDANRKKMGDFFAVYDGHSGDKASSLLQEKLHKYFAKAVTVGKEKKAFETAFDKIEKEALESFDDGSTAVVGYVDKKDILHAAWVGDSRLVVECNGGVGFATEDHKPDRPDERDRIENGAYGKVYMNGVWRVLGLAVSRSIGDRPVKNADIGRKNGGFPGRVIADPEYAQYQLTPDNNFAIIASDGLWDAVKNHEAISLVKNVFKERGSRDDAARALQDEAIKRGSGDNITIIVSQFNWSQK